MGIIFGLTQKKYFKNVQSLQYVFEFTMIIFRSAHRWVIKKKTLILFTNKTHFSVLRHSFPWTTFTDLEERLEQ